MQSSGSCLPAAPRAQPLGVGVLWGGWLLAARGSAVHTALGPFLQPLQLQFGAPLPGKWFLEGS